VTSPALLDASVLIALFDLGHVHHDVAHESGDAGQCGADGDDRARTHDASRLFVAELTTLEAGVGVRERERLRDRFE